MTTKEDFEQQITEYFNANQELPTEVTAGKGGLVYRLHISRIHKNVSCDTYGTNPYIVVTYASSYGWYYVGFHIKPKIENGKITVGIHSPRVVNEAIRA